MILRRAKRTIHTECAKQNILVKLHQIRITPHFVEPPKFKYTGKYVLSGGPGKCGFVVTEEEAWSLLGHGQRWAHAALSAGYPTVRG